MALVEQQGWPVHDVYVDNDISATSGKARPEYRRMLRAIEAGEVDAVVAWHPDRLYRKLTDLEGLIEAIDQNNVVMRTVRAGEIDLSTPTGRMLARILSATAQAEGEIKSDRWRRSVMQRREAGVWAHSGPRLFGWTREGEVIEAEAEAIRWMADEVINGASSLSIAKRLNDRGILTTLGNLWQVQSVTKLLCNPRLAGHATLSRSVKVKRSDGTTVRKREVSIVGRGEWQPILDPDVWENVRALLTAGRRPSTNVRVALLAGMMKCGRCGAKMVTGARMRRAGGTVRVYRCTRLPGAGGCGKLSVHAEAVEQVVEAYARKRLEDPRVRKHLAELRAVPATDAAELATLEDRIVELEAQLDQPGVPVTTILGAIERARTRRDELMRALSTATPRDLPGGGSAWPKDLGRRHALVSLVVESVTVKPADRVGGPFDPRRVKIKRRG